MSDDKTSNRKLRMLISEWRDEILSETHDGNIVYKNGRVNGLKKAIDDLEEVIDD